MVSTHFLSRLPDIPTLRDRMQQMAALNGTFAVLLELCEPTFAFAPNWSRSTQLGCYDNGCGDELYTHFTPKGCFIKGFAHESEMTPYRVDPPVLWPGLLDDVPAEFSASLAEPAFDIPATTFVLWRLASGHAWHTPDIAYPSGPDCDGSSDILSDLLMSPPEFTDWLEEDYETDVDGSIVESVFNGEPLSSASLQALCPDARLSDLAAAVAETGYPIA